jgi:hypothetical protein
MPLLDVSVPYMSHPQGAQVPDEMFTLRHGCRGKRKWMLRVVCPVCPVHTRYLQLTGRTTLNSHFHYPRHPWRSVNIFHQELWAPWRWRMYGAETCRSGINILNVLFTSRMHFVGFNSLYSWPSACQESIWDTQVVAPSILNLKTRQGGGQLQCSVKFTIEESASGATEQEAE